MTDSLFLKKMPTTQESMEYILITHVVLVAISLFILIVQFIHVNVNFELLEKQILQLVGRIESLEQEQYEVNRFLFAPSTKEQVEEAETAEEAEEAEETDMLSVDMEESKED